MFSDSSPSDSLYFLDSGLVKLFKRGEDGKEIILRIVAPGELFGEQALPGEEGRTFETRQRKCYRKVSSTSSRAQYS